MRYTYFRLLILVIATVFMFSSCSKVPEHMNIIPADASFVVMLNTKQLMFKAQMDKFKETNVFKKIKTEIEAESPELSKLLDELIKEPQKSGIKILSNMAVYMEGDATSGFKAGIVAGVSDKEQLKSLIEKVIKEAKIEKKIETDNDITYIDIKPAILMWNKKCLLLSFNDNYNISAQDRFDYAKKQISSTNKEKSITSVPDFKTFYKKGKDVDMWVSGENIQKMSPAPNPLMSIYPNYFFKTNTHIHVEFANGEIIMDSESFMSDSLKAELAKKPLMKAFSSQESLKALPDKSLMALSFAINMGNFYDMFISKLPNIDQADAGLKQQNIGSLRELVESFGGDFIISINDVDTESSSYPTKMPVYDDETEKVDYIDTVITNTKPIINGAICMSLKTTKPFDMLLAQLPEGQLQKDGDVITLPMPLFPLYMNLSGNMVVISTSKDIADKSNKGGMDKNLLASETGKKIIKNGSYFYMDLNVKSYPKLEKFLLENKENEPQKMAIYNFWSIFDATEAMASPDGLTSTGAIKLTSGKENSLYFILKTIDENIEKIVQ